MDYLFYPGEKCFACINRFGKWECNALNVSKCPGKSCSTYKTEEQVIFEKKKCLDRICSLPDNKRLAIFEKYGVK